MADSINPGGQEREPMSTVLGVFARANHPEGYGQGQRAHGYVVVVVQCDDWDELAAVDAKLSRPHYEPDPDRPGLNRPMMPPGVDPWKRGDAWYAGPYELVWASAVERVREARPMNLKFGITLGDRPSYGDNRAMAYLAASEVLDA